MELTLLNSKAAASFADKKSSLQVKLMTNNKISQKLINSLTFFFDFAQDSCGLTTQRIHICVYNYNLDNC
jgi:hypothetical protein